MNGKNEKTSAAIAVSAAAWLWADGHERVRALYWSSGQARKDCDENLRGATRGRFVRTVVYPG